MIPSETRKRWASWGVPWWERLLMRAVFFAVMAPCFVWTLGMVALALAGAAASRLLPPSWRPVWPEPPVPEPDAAADCPSCRSPLTTATAADGVQRGACPGCGRRAVRVYRRMTFGGFWSPWEPDA